MFIYTSKGGKILTIANYQFDDDFTEKDLLWTPDHQEQDPSITIRARKFLIYLFENDARIYIGITGHGGIIGGILRAIGHRSAVVETGSLIPVVVSLSSRLNIERKRVSEIRWARGLRLG